jgi:hypothetical protein
MVRIGDMTFADWVSLEYDEGWTDTFIFRVSSQACLPPFEYVPLLKRMVAHTRRKRRSASLWVQVDAPGEWFAAELKHSLRGLRLPFAVTCGDQTPDFADFSVRPWLGFASSGRPPTVEEKPLPISMEELSCLQALGRMEKGQMEEVAAQAGLPNERTRTLLHALSEKRLVVYQTSPLVRRGKSKAVQIDLFPAWELNGKGLSLALRSWGAPKGVDFRTRREKHPREIGSDHRALSRIWPAWLKAAWPQAEIWAGWSEVRLPGMSVIPDGLAWGRMQGYEALFWLEVGDAHKANEQIERDTTTRLAKARELCSRTGIRLVYTQLSVNWVHRATRWACVNIPSGAAVVMGDHRRFGELPVAEWGRVT